MVDQIRSESSGRVTSSFAILVPRHPRSDGALSTAFIPDTLTAAHLLPHPPNSTRFSFQYAAAAASLSAVTSLAGSHHHPPAPPPPPPPLLFYPAAGYPLGLTSAVWSSAGRLASKTSSIADLRMKARKHAETLGAALGPRLSPV